MRSLISLVLTAAIGLGVYYFYLKSAAPAPGRVATQAITTTGVQMDLVAIAQAERVYFAQNGSYGTLDQLTSNGAMNITRTERDGYTYSADPSSNGFVVTASHPDVPAPAGSPASTLHYPTLSIDQNMQVQQNN
jgi:hypothetical protein